MSEKPVSVVIDDWRMKGFTGWASRFNGGRELVIQIGPFTATRIVPPAGEVAAFERLDPAHRVTVYISPTGRSVRVWFDGEEVGNDR